MTIIAPLMLASLPLGISAQNILVSIGLLASLPTLWRTRGYGAALCRRFKWPLVIALLFTVWPIIATWLNPQNPIRFASSSVFGLLPWLILPLVVCWVSPKPDGMDWRRWENGLAVLCALWGAVALSQYIFGWRVLGIAFVSDVPRPRGFYSHPLTLAYAALLPWPLAVRSFVTDPRRWQSWAMTGGLGVILLFTQSRTVQLVALVVGMVIVMWNASSRRRLAIVVGLSLAVGTVLATPNPVGQHFRATFSSAGVDKHQSAYADDRLAFWHVHALMIAERPILGHGVALDSTYRAPYYERLGLRDFKKQYEAHNQFLQIFAEGGLIGFSLFALWLGWHLRQAWLTDRRRGATPIFTITFAAFIVAGLTQNSFQDGEVRLGLTILVAALWLEAKSLSREYL